MTRFDASSDSPIARPDFFRELLDHVGFTAEDSAVLAGAMPSPERLQLVIDHFYADLEAHAPTRRILTDDDVVVRLKCTLFDWIVSLFRGPHDDAYFERRCRIGRRHVQIGLDQHYMFTAMALIREDLSDAIEESHGEQPEARLRITRALHKLLDLELAVMLESYRESRFEIEMLRESERKYRDLIENAPEMILTVDRAGRIQHINRTALDVLAWGEAENPDRLLDLVVPEGRDAAWRNIEPLFGEGAAGAPEFETRFRTRSGDLRTVRVRASGLAATTHGDPAIRLFIQDVTEARELEARMAEYARQVEEKRRLAAIGQMVAGIAHEIRTPLQVITTGIDSLVQAASNRGMEREIARTKEGIRRVRGFIQEILDYSKEIHLERIPFEPSTLVASVLADLALEIERARIQVSTWFHPDLTRVEADAFRIKQVIGNLIQNAVEAVPPGGSIDIEVRPSWEAGASVVEFIIRDAGRGIPEADLNKIFVPFYTTKPRGTGLGLPIVQRIVDAHGGRIEIHSRSGEGTEVRIRIPMEARERCPANAS